MITLKEKSVLSGDHVVFVGRKEIYADSQEQTINIPATGSISAIDVDEFIEAVMMAKKLATKQIALSIQPDFPGVSCTVPGMPCNSKGYVLEKAFYIDEDDGKICVDHHYCPLEKPSEEPCILLFRDTDGSFYVNDRYLHDADLPKKKSGKFRDVVNLHWLLQK